jgi:hypothetical protein
MLLKSCKIVQYKTKVYVLQLSLGRKVTSYTTSMAKTQLGKTGIHFIVEAFQECK